MANVNRPHGFRAIRNTAGGAIPLFSGLAAFSTVLAPGDALIVDANGYLTIALAASTAIVGVCQSTITSSASVHKVVNFVPAIPSIIFEGQASGTPTQALIGTACDIEGATGVQLINEDATTTTVAQVVGFGQEVDNSIGQYAKVQFIWRPSDFTGQA